MHSDNCSMAVQRGQAQQQPGAHRQYTPMRQPGRQPPAPPASTSWASPRSTAHQGLICRRVLLYEDRLTSTASGAV